MANSKQPQRQAKPPRTRAAKVKKKISILVQERVEYVDYKDVNLLQRFVSDRSKIRARRVSGNDSQQQRDVATAIKNAREMALLPYTKRVTTQRSPGPIAATVVSAVTGASVVTGPIAGPSGSRVDTDAVAPTSVDADAVDTDVQSRRRARGRRRGRGGMSAMKVILRSRRRQRRQAGRHLRGLERLRPQLPASPKRLAIVATDGAVAQAAAMRRARDLRDAQDRSAAEEVARTLVPKVITIRPRPGTEGRLFGSVTSADIVDAVAAQTGVELDRRKLQLGEPIKSARHALGARAAASRGRVPRHRRGRRRLPVAGPHPAVHMHRRCAAGVPQPRPLHVHTITTRGPSTIDPQLRTARVRQPMAEGSDRRPRRPTRRGRRIPPHNLDAEASLLGALLLSRGRDRGVTEARHRRDDFYKPAHQHVYEAITSLSSAGEPVDAVTVAEELRRSDLLDDIGGPTVLLDLQAATPAISQRRAATPASCRTPPCCAGSSAWRRDRRARLRRARRRHEGPRRGRDEGVRASPSTGSRIHDADRRPAAAGLQTTSSSATSGAIAVTGTPTGYTDLDELLTGLQPSTLTSSGPARRWASASPGTPSARPGHRRAGARRPSSTSGARPGSGCRSCRSTATAAYRSPHRRPSSTTACKPVFEVRTRLGRVRAHHAAPPLPHRPGMAAPRRAGHRRRRSPCRTRCRTSATTGSRAARSLLAHLVGDGLRGRRRSVGTRVRQWSQTSWCMRRARRACRAAPTRSRGVPLVARTGPRSRRGRRGATGCSAMGRSWLPAACSACRATSSRSSSTGSSQRRDRPPARDRAGGDPLRPASTRRWRSGVQHLLLRFGVSPRSCPRNACARTG